MLLHHCVGSRVVAALLVGAGGMALGCGSSGDEDAPNPSVLSECLGALAFEHRPIDNDFTGENKALGDLDGDGVLDVIVGGSLLRWYPAPDFAPREIPGSAGSLAMHMEAADMNGDGAVDIVTPDGAELYWFENPRGGGGSVDDEWPKHLIGDQGRPAHEVDLGDFNGDGRLDVVTNPNLNLWLQGEPGAEWSQVVLHAYASSEGMAVGLIDGDDRPDIAVRGAWLRTPEDATDEAAFELFTIDETVQNIVSVRVADVDGDGRSDVVHAPQEAEGEIVVYSAEEPTGAWSAQPVGPAGAVHDFVVADMDRDGSNDLVFAEMAGSPEKRVGVFLHAEDAWRLEVFAATGSHNIVVGDVDGDCDLDVAGSNWEAPPVEIWLNAVCSGGPRACE